MTSPSSRPGKETSREIISHSFLGEERRRNPPRFSDCDWNEYMMLHWLGFRSLMSAWISPWAECGPCYRPFVSHACHSILPLLRSPGNDKLTWNSFCSLHLPSADRLREIVDVFSPYRQGHSESREKKYRKIWRQFYGNIFQKNNNKHGEFLVSVFSVSGIPVSRF